MTHLAKTQGKAAVTAVLSGPDGRIYNLGRVDRKWWAPRLWIYRWIIYPRRRANERRTP